jgi:hypothetical protein
MNTTLAYIICESSAKDVEFNIVNQNRDFVIAEGIIQEAEEENRNKRCYAHDDLYKEIHCAKQQEMVTSGNFKGEAGHPSANDLARQQKVDPFMEQVWYTKLWMEGNLVKANFRGTNNDLGRSFNDDLKDGAKPSFSLRALGTIIQNAGKAYVRNLKIVTYDRVYYPSHPKAYTTKIISEGASAQANKYIYIPKMVEEHGNIQLVEEGFQIITPITNASVRDYIMAESANLNTIVNNFDTFYESILLSEDGKSVTLVDKNYDRIVVPVERHIQNEVMNFCFKL